MEFTSALGSLGDTTMNQNAPTIKIAILESFAIFFKSKLPPKNAITAKSQLAARGNAACWQG
jgi:hypothetical protein